MSSTTPVAVEPVVQPAPEPVWPDVAHLVTEDGAPVDSVFSEKQMRLLTEPLYSSWGGPDGKREFLAMANVGVFYEMKQPPIVPDVLLSVGVTAPEDPHPKANRSYFIWRYGKPPDVVIEVVSNKEGGEDSTKRDIYARIGVAYYVIFDPERWLSPDAMRVLVRNGSAYHQRSETWFPAVALGLTPWHGVFEGMDTIWLRWCDRDGQLIPTGAERAELERQRAEEERQRAEEERQRAETAQLRAETERQRADAEHELTVAADRRIEQLAAMLRAHGIEPPA